LTVSLPHLGRLFLFFLACFCSQPAYAAEMIYQSPENFLVENVPGCGQQALWLKSDVKLQIEQLIGHPFPGVRVRYCQEGEKTAWILDEIGKTEPITSGIIVNQGQVETVRVLVFRESRGNEVHRSAFTRQYESAVLDDKNRLDRHIDGITGATLSVSALNRQVKLALLLDRIAREKIDDD
jgi:hypothetical protein